MVLLGKTVYHILYGPNGNEACCLVDIRPMPMVRSSWGLDAGLDRGGQETPGLLCYVCKWPPSRFVSRARQGP